MKLKNLVVSLLTGSIAIGLVPQAVFAKDKSSDSSSPKAGSDVRLSKLIGTNLKTASGEDLGEVKDVVLDPQSGKVGFAIVGVDEGNGVEALAPIPWKAVNIHSEKEYVATIDKNKLKKGPHMSSEQWDKLMQPDYVVQIYRFYGFEPPSAEGNAESPGGSGTGSAQQNPQGQGQSSGDQNSSSGSSSGQLHQK